MSVVKIWKGISFNEINWKVSTSKLDDLSPSWSRKREQFKKNETEFKKFMDKLKREQAIETGIIEKLYDLKDGVTQTLIKEGFIESYLHHGDTNISSFQLFKYLKDHFDAMDFVFDAVNNQRPISISFIKELHQLITQHQDFTDAITPDGRPTKIKLLKGSFKEHDNNPQRSDGTIFTYCPPINVIDEMDILVETLAKLENESKHAIVIAAWLHHSFTQIHPFQDGNGRIARLLASLILIKYNFFPLNIKATAKHKYIDALELADDNQPQLLVDLFCDVQRKNIEEVLNINVGIDNTQSEFSHVASKFAEKFGDWKLRQSQEKITKINQNKIGIFDNVKEILNSAINELKQHFHDEQSQLYLEECYPDNNGKNHWYKHQIIEYAKYHNYFFNYHLTKGWFRMALSLSEDRQYQLVFSIHHYGYDEMTMAIGAFLETMEPVNTNAIKKSVSKSSRSGTRTSNKTITNVPIIVEPYVVSLSANPETIFENLKIYILDVVKIVLAQIAGEL